MESETPEKIRNVFWTGGWDSTYMVLKMLRDGETVRPIYIINPRRKSRFLEMDSLAKMEGLIKQRIKSGKLLPLEKYDLRKIKIDKNIRKAFEVINKGLVKDNRRPLGYQYKYLASFAKIYHDQYPVISVGVEKSSKMETGGMEKTIAKFGKMTPDFRVDKEVSQEVLVTLLSNFDFPIIDKTELEMLEDIHKWHYEDIMQEIWFCHKPIEGKACGFCSPCCQKAISGTDFLLSDTAKERFKKFKAIEKKYGRHAKLTAAFFYRLFKPKA